MRRTNTFAILLFVCVASTAPAYGQSVRTAVKDNDSLKIFSLSNNKVTQKIFIRHGRLMGDLLTGNESWLDSQHAKGASVWSDGNFTLKIMWTGWSAPGRQINADVQVSLDKQDYTLDHYSFRDDQQGQDLELYFKPVNTQNTMMLRMTYQLLPGKFYARRKLAVRDTIKGSNWLDTFISRKGKVSNRNHSAEGNALEAAVHVVKAGSFGQPCAVAFAHGGAFFGIEYPAATNTVKMNHKGSFDLHCKEIIGTVVKGSWIESKWVVEGLSPDHHVKQWFFKYLPDIKVAADRPYALYNSWYDLRSPAFKDVAPEHIMNEKNILHIIDLFKKNMIAPYGIHLNAFVLDDGWDVHHSDWQLRKTTFPHGLKPISDELKKLGTTLGIWYGPTGGYSFRADRISWMGDHGYEVTGSGDDAMMCIGGKKYSALFRQRTTDMVKNGGVGYFKWDGIQFSCSDPSHGHPTGYYSRRAILDSVIAKCEAVRAVNPDVYLNITSGTWLSPWWMKYANQIWMQGNDFGFADVPSVNQRDASMTYKDFVLYNDFKIQDEWFPLSNLMTHGIIKGTLNEIGGEDDPLTKFTDDAMFYFARGVTMYELYISPDLLTQGEWVALSKSLKWAEDRFAVLKHTNMIGGAPAKGEAYGYVHFKGNKGILALRNPGMKTQNIRVHLNPGYGIDPEARSLVLERVYPSHWISPDLYSAGAIVSLPLTGYETAIYELYPLDSADRPLIAGVTFDADSLSGGNQYAMDVLQAGPVVKVLNPGEIAAISVEGKPQSPDHLQLQAEAPAKVLLHKQLEFQQDGIHSELTFGKDVVEPRFVVFLRPDSAFKGKPLPEGKLLVDGKAVQATRQQQKGIWSVYSFPLDSTHASGRHSFDLQLSKNNTTPAWKGTAEVWLISRKKQATESVTVTATQTIQQRPAPPNPYGRKVLKENIELGMGTISL